MSLSGYAQILKRCPFCGGKAELRKEPHPLNEAYNRYQAVCPECQAAGKVFLDGPTMQIGDRPAEVITEEEAAEKAVEAWNHRTGPDITEIEDGIYELSIAIERVEAIADELQQEYFGEAEPENSMLKANYDRGRILSNIVFDYAHRAKEITEALERKV